MKTIEVLKEYVSVYYDGSNDLNILITLMEEIAEVCKRENKKKLLIDLRNMTGEPKFMDRFRLGITAVRIFRGFLKIAIVYKKVESNRFAETVAINRGLPTRITHDLEEAKHWLEVE
jgi:hypothetical protein